MNCFGDFFFFCIKYYSANMGGINVQSKESVNITVGTTAYLLHSSSISHRLI